MPRNEVYCHHRRSCYTPGCTRTFSSHTSCLCSCSRTRHACSLWQLREQRRPNGICPIMFHRILRCARHAGHLDTSLLSFVTSVVRLDTTTSNVHRYPRSTIPLNSFPWSFCDADTAVYVFVLVHVWVVGCGLWQLTRRVPPKPPVRITLLPATSTSLLATTWYTHTRENVLLVRSAVLSDSLVPSCDCMGNPCCYLAPPKPLVLAR